MSQPRPGVLKGFPRIDGPARGVALIPLLLVCLGLGASLESSLPNPPQSIPQLPEKPPSEEQALFAIRMQLARHPESAPLYFTLGNQLAARERWQEAQAAYFQAHVLDSGNPDYLFNLAISLEHLNQPRLAARHYQQALAATRQRASAFAPEQATRRLEALVEAP